VLALSPLGFLGLKHVKLPLLGRHAARRYFMKMAISAQLFVLGKY